MKILSCIIKFLTKIQIFLFYSDYIYQHNIILFSAKYPQWIPYAIIGSTGVSLPLVALVKEEYNRSAFDSEDTTPENEVNQDIIDDENVENS